MQRFRKPTAAFAVIAAELCAAADVDGTARALALISSFAREICQPVSDSSSSVKVEATGSAELKLNALIRKIGDLGIKGSVGVSETKTTGVLQQDLAKAYRDSNECRLHVLDTLQGKLLPPAPPDPAAQRMAGRWRPGEPDGPTPRSNMDGLAGVVVVVRGNRFEAQETNRHGTLVSTIDGTVDAAVVDGQVFQEANPNPRSPAELKVPERVRIGRIQLQLSPDGNHLFGVLAVERKSGGSAMQVKVDYYRE